MIYQLKITLQHTSPPVWRRIQLDSKTTFATLHELLQIAFDWLGYHMHTFEVKDPHNQIIYIEPVEVEEDAFGFFYNKVKLDEKEVILEKFLKKEKDKCIYIYDFGDDWRHEIVLEKIVEPEQGATYPRCIKAMRLAPEEDSSGFWVEDETSEKVDNKQLAEEINKVFQSFQKEAVAESNAGSDLTDWQRLFDYAIQFKKLKPWEWLSDNQIIAVKLPDTGEFTYCCVLGEMGEEFGLAIYLGNDGLISLQKIMSGSENFHNIVTRQRSILVSFTDRDELEQWDYDLIKRLGLTFRGKKQWPLFRSFKPGYYPWYIDEQEVKIASIALEQVLDVAVRTGKDDQLVPDSRSEQWFARIPVATGGQLEWRDATITPEVIENSTPSELYVSEFELKQLRKNVSKRLNAVIEFGTFYFHEPVQDEKGLRPYYPNVVIGADQKSGLILYYKMIGQERFEEQYQHTFLKMIQQLGQIPQEVWVEGTESFNILQPVFKALSIKALQADKLRLIQEIKKHMMELNI
ncbi:plasmid pRiA4b ORF-3 family protein [Tepidibacillus sp. LV47]|uniref:plasmid pRiA4b ORF-3 family protein n=1 Tax=Tepidibacillus sp. LV47 TaxID=3398228 RepID=UPI003AAE08F7